MIIVFNGTGQLTQGNSGCHYIYTRIVIVIKQVYEACHWIVWVDGCGLLSNHHAISVQGISQTLAGYAHEREKLRVLFWWHVFQLYAVKVSLVCCVFSLAGYLQFD
jgi:hypothetical protein